MTVLKRKKKYNRKSSQKLPTAAVYCARDDEMEWHFKISRTAETTGELGCIGAKERVIGL